MSISTTISTTSTNSIFTNGSGSLTTNGSGTISTGNLGTYYNGYTSSFDPYMKFNELKLLSYNVDFQFNAKEFTKKILTDNIKGIKKNKFIFNCNVINNRIQPYELIMKLIEKKENFPVKVKISDILTICYTNFRFTKIENNFNFSDKDKCDFSELKVRFKYDNILYENHKLSTKQLRTDKMKKIMDNNI